MNILITPDKFKGTLSSTEICDILEKSIAAKAKNVSIDCLPIADGGDGSLAALFSSLNLERVEVKSVDPLGRSLDTFYYRKNNVAYIELAHTSGLVLLTSEERDPTKTSSFGTGLVIKEALLSGCQTINLFIGGSATNDAGMGIAQALGVAFYDEKGDVLAANGGRLKKVRKIRKSAFLKPLTLQLNILCDVANPLLGPNGAAHIYARQKGADDAMIGSLEDGMIHFTAVLREHYSVDVSGFQGGGAAGGIGAGLNAMFGAKIVPGFETIAKWLQLEDKIREADVVITGEGALDHQSLHGKVVSGVATLCKRYHKPLVLMVGQNRLDRTALEKFNAAKVYEIMDHASGLEDAFSRSGTHLQKMGEIFGESLNSGLLSQ